LADFRYKKLFEAEDGGKGRGNKSSGKDGGDLIVKVPAGTLIKKEGKVVMDLDEVGKKIKIASGGKGGRGNWHFRSSTNQTPQEFEEGTKGERFELELELRLLAEVGLVGLPNVGKSTLLSVLTKARPKIADYQFTTLEPNLGVMEFGGGKRRKTVVVADIPGLIEGASKGKGLGDQFLRHVERTRLLVHVLAVDPGSDDGFGAIWGNYETIRKEMGEHHKDLLEKKEILILNKVDIMKDDVLKEVVEGFEKKGKELLLVSAGTGRGVEELKEKIVEMTS